MSQELRDAMGELAARQDPGFHPDPEALAAYHAGALDAAGEERLREHLAACPECAALLLDLEDLGDPGFGAGNGAAGKEAVWQRLRQETVAPRRAVPIRRPAAASPRWLQALAASLVVATLGLSLWVASLRRTVAELSGPETHALVLDLDAGTARGGREGENEDLPVAVVPPGVQRFILAMTPEGRLESGYRLEVERSGGAKVLSLPGLEPNRFGSLSPAFSRHDLGPGDYRLHLLGPGGEPIAEYALRVEGR